MLKGSASPNLSRMLPKGLVNDPTSLVHGESYNKVKSNVNHAFKNNINLPLITGLVGIVEAE